MNSEIALSVTASPRLVLVADDEPAIRKLVVRMIHHLGLIALPVEDGAAALQAATLHRVELLCAILDVQMPAMNGADAAHAIQEKLPDLAIILMSGAIPSHCIERIESLRLAGMLHKPFSLETLRTVITTLNENTLTHKLQIIAKEAQ